MGIIEEIIEDGHPEAEAGRPKSQFHEGATVQLHSLAAAPQYNGVNGELVREHREQDFVVPRACDVASGTLTYRGCAQGFFSEDTGRWEVYPKT
jgi:hypothetical protein